MKHILITGIEPITKSLQRWSWAGSHVAAVTIKMHPVRPEEFYLLAAARVGSGGVEALDAADAAT